MRERPQTYAVTLVCAGRERLFLHGDTALTMLNLLRRYRGEDRFRLHAFVAMPDHVHVVISPRNSLEQAVGLIKGGFSFAVRKTWRGEVWQESYYSHRIVDETDYEAQVQYVAGNPARQGYDASYAHVHTQHEDMVDPKPVHLGG